MAVVIDGSGTPNGVTGGVVSACVLTVSSSATALMAMLSFGSTIATTITVSWDSSTQFLTQLASINSTASSSNTTTTIWGLLNPHPGSGLLIRAQWAGATNATLDAISFFNTPTDTIANCFPHTTTATSVSQLPSAAVTSQSSNLVIGLVSASSGATIDSVNNTQIYIRNLNGAPSGANQSSGQASVTISGSLAASGAWGAVGVDVAAAASVTLASFQAGAWAALPARYVVIGAG